MNNSGIRENPFAVGCIVMASGDSRRFGRNKLLEPINGKPMIAYALDLIQKVGFARKLVVTREEKIAALCDERGIAVLLHSLPKVNDTIRLGLERFQSEDPDLAGCVFLTGDQPFLRAESLAALLAGFRENPDRIFRMSFGGTDGSPVLFPSDLFGALLRLPEGSGGSALIRRMPERVARVCAADAWELYDIDTPEALKRALRR